MAVENYYVYCDNVLGVKTNIPDFKWVYGSFAPCVSREEYYSCAVKLEVCVKPEKHLSSISECEQFQSYYFDAEKKTISCRRTIIGCVSIGYDIMVADGMIVATIGSNYYKFVQKRVMNLHSAYYLLSDLANLLLLKKGYLTLYASGVCFAPMNKGIVCFAPPNTGKTLTAVGLCARKGYSLVGEDVVIVSNKQLYSCPWTASYRKKKSKFDSAGSVFRAKPEVELPKCKTCELTDLIVLAVGEEHLVCNPKETLRRIRILNGYLFQHFSSPIVKILGYFDSLYDLNWNKCAFRELQKLANADNCHIVYARDPFRFNELVHSVVGESV